MGNWMTVSLSGSVAPEDLAALSEWVNIGDDWGKFHPLCNPGPSICGLGNWTRTEINTSGNCAERNYDAESVAEALRDAIKVAPSLALKVHCGGDYESKDCVATVTVLNGEVSVGPAEVEKVTGISEGEMGFRLGRMVGGLG